MSSPSSSPLPPPGPLCESCGQRPANHFVCQINFHGRQTNLQLCAECFQDQGFDFPSLENARCFYCGGPPCGVGLNDPHEIAVRHQRVHHTCDRCGELSNQFMLNALSRLPKGLSRAEQSRHLEQMVREVDERVRTILRGNPNG